MFKNLNLNYRFSKKTVINLLITAAYALLTLIFVAHHEIWRDEAQVWLIIKNTSLSGLFSQLTVEGHPCLFYLLLYPFVKLGFSIVSMQIICWLSMVCSVFLLWQFSPFAVFTKAVITLSSGFMYFFPVIARSYSILPLLLFAAAILYAKQDKHPILYAIILACIANTHIIMFGFVSCLFVIFVYKNFFQKIKHPKHTLLPALIIFFSIVAVIIQLHNTVNLNDYIGHETVNISNTYKFIHNFLIDIYDNGFTIICENASYALIPKLINNNILKTVINTGILTIVLFTFVLLYKIDKSLFYTALLGILFQLVIYISSYAIILPNRLLCTILILMFSLWAALNIDRKHIKENYFPKKAFYINNLVSLLMIITIPNGINFIQADIKNNYSSGKEMANFINNNISTDSVIVTNQPSCSMSISYYLKNRSLLFNGEPVKFVHWKANKIEDNATGLIKYVKENKNIYELIPASININFLKNSDLNIIYLTKPSIALCEDFVLVKIY